MKRLLCFVIVCTVILLAAGCQNTEDARVPDKAHEELAETDDNMLSDGSSESVADDDGGIELPDPPAEARSYSSFNSFTWKNNYDKADNDKWQATYTDFEGFQSRNIQYPDPGVHVIKVEVTTDAGTLNLFVTNSEGDTLFKQTEIETSNFSFNVEGDSVDVRVEGSAHSGGFVIRWNDTEKSDGIASVGDNENTGLPGILDEGYVYDWPNQVSRGYCTWNSDGFFFELPVDAPCTVVFDLLVDAGSLSVSVKDPKGKEIFLQSEMTTSSHKITFESAGTYVVKMVAADHTGSYSFSPE